MAIIYRYVTLTKTLPGIKCTDDAAGTKEILQKIRTRAEIKMQQILGILPTALNDYKYGMYFCPYCGYKVMAFVIHNKSSQGKEKQRCYHQNESIPFIYRDEIYLALAARVWHITCVQGHHFKRIKYNPAHVKPYNSNNENVDGMQVLKRSAQHAMNRTHHLARVKNNIIAFNELLSI